MYLDFLVCLFVCLFVWWCLTPLSTIFPLYRAVNFIGGGNWSARRKLPTCNKSLTNVITYCCIEYTSPWAGFELTTLVVICTECIGSCKSKYHTITIMTTPCSRTFLMNLIAHIIILNEIMTTVNLLKTKSNKIQKKQRLRFTTQTVIVYCNNYKFKINPWK